MRDEKGNPIPGTFIRNYRDRARRRRRRWFSRGTRNEWRSCVTFPLLFSPFFSLFVTLLSVRYIKSNNASRRNAFPPSRLCLFIQTGGCNAGVLFSDKDSFRICITKISSSSPRAASYPYSSWRSSNLNFLFPPRMHPSDCGDSVDAVAVTAGIAKRRFRIFRRKVVSLPSRDERKMMCPGRIISTQRERETRN